MLPGNYISDRCCLLCGNFIGIVPHIALFGQIPICQKINNLGDHFFDFAQLQYFGQYLTLWSWYISAACSCTCLWLLAAVTSYFRVGWTAPSKMYTATKTKNVNVGGKTGKAGERPCWDSVFNHFMLCSISFFFLYIALIKLSTCVTRGNICRASLVRWC